MSKTVLSFKLTGDLWADELDSWGLLGLPDSKGKIANMLVSPIHCREEFLADVVAALMYAKGKDPIKNALIGKNGWSYIMLSLALYSDDLLPEGERYRTDYYYPPKKPSVQDKTILEKKKNLSLAEHQKRHEMVKEAIELLNYFESKAHWKKSKLMLGPLTSEERVDSLWYESAYWVFRVNSKWMNSTYMFSMLILILRAGIYLDPTKVKAYANGGPWGRIKDHKSDALEHMDFPNEVYEHVSSTAHYWEKILKNYADLFPVHKEDRFYYWKRAAYEEGISCLVSGDVNDFAMSKRMNILKRRSKITKADLKKISKMETDCDDSWHEEEDW